MDYNSITETENESFDFKKEFFKYFYYWKYFILALTLCLCTAYIYNRYSSKLYSTTAKIKILDKGNSPLEMPSAEGMFSSSNINLENEKELIISYPILEKVVERLNLNLSVYLNGDIKNQLLSKEEYPFVIKSKIKRQDIFASDYKVFLTEEGIKIIDYRNDDKLYLFKNFTSTKTNHDLPFEIYNIDKAKIGLDPYILKYKTTKQKIAELKTHIVLNQVSKNSDILSINYNTSNVNYAESVVNELINTYNKDGIVDRQLIHKRTIDFVDSRFAYLTKQLDSIEYSKQRFKQENKIVELSANSNLSLEKRAASE